MEWWQAALCGAAGALVPTLGEAIAANDKRREILREGGRDDPRLSSNEFSTGYRVAWVQGQILRLAAAILVVPLLGDAGFDRALPAATLGVSVALMGKKVAGMFVSDEPAGP